MGTLWAQIDFGQKIISLTQFKKCAKLMKNRKKKRIEVVATGGHYECGGNERITWKLI
jgi:hypothetical protein